MRSRIAAALVLATASVAVAQPRVVIVEGTGDPALPALGAQVAVQASADVEVVALDGSPDGPSFVARASELAAEHDAVLVVWVSSQEGGDPGVYVVYAVGRDPERAVIELVRVETATPASEIERVVALKVASLLDELLAPAPTLTILGIPEPEAPAPVTISPPAIPRWTVDLGAAVAVDDAIAGVDLLVARWWRDDALSVAAEVGARWLPSRGIVAPEILGSIGEVDLRFGAAGAADLGPVEALATAAASFGGVRARGTTPDGRGGAVTEVVPWLGAGVGVHRDLTGPIGARLTFGYDRALIHQRFLADGAVVANLGQHRFLVTLSVSVDLR